MMNSSPTPAVDFDHPNNKLRRELECSICLNIFEDPRQLACGHVFCGDCVVPLIERVNADQTKLTIKCPLCRRETEVPPDGQLPMAIVVKNLIEHFKEGSFHMEGNASENKEAATTTAINSDTSRKARDDYLAMVLSPAALVTSQPEPSGFYNNRIATMGALVTSQPEPSGYENYNNPNPNGCTETGDLRPLYGEEETCCSDCDCSLCDDPECANLLCACLLECFCRLFCLALAESCNDNN